MRLGNLPPRSNCAIWPTVTWMSALGSTLDGTSLSDIPSFSSSAAYRWPSGTIWPTDLFCSLELICNKSAIVDNSKKQYTDVFFIGRHDQVLGFEHDDGEPFGRRQVTERDEQLRSTLVRQRVAHHIRPDVDSRPGAAAAKHILSIGQRKMKVSDDARSRESIVLANLSSCQPKKKKYKII